MILNGVTITPIYLAIYSLIFVLLSFVVIGHRRSKGVSLFTGDDQVMAYKMRAHANFAEYAPFLILLMLVLELNSIQAWILHAMGLTFLAGRLMHSYSFLFIESKKENPSRIFRVLGMVLTFVSIIAGAKLILFSLFFH